jgi:iron complex outermembrane receptor protein
MLQKKLILGMALAWLVLASASLLAQEALLSGRITDAESGEGLISATIRVGEEGQLTDFDGKFAFTLAPGTYELEVRYLGYETYRQQITLAAGDHPSLDLSLKESATLLQTATVSSSRYAKPLSEVTVSLEVLQPQLIENAGKVSLDDALQKIPGVTVIDGQANIRSGSGYSQGAGSRVLLLMDDIPILTADAGFPNWTDIPMEVIDQVEVIKGAASALYGSSALNGIVNVRTAYATSEPITKGALFSTVYLAPERESLKWWEAGETPRLLGASISHRRKLGKVDLVLGGYYQDLQSFRRDVSDTYGRFNFNVRHRVTDRLSYGLSGNLNAGKSTNYFFWSSLDSAYVGSANSLSSRERVRYNLDPSLLYYDQQGNRHRLLGRFFSVDNENDRMQGNQSRLFYGEYQFQRRFTERDLVLTAGVVAGGTRVEAELYGDTTFTSSNYAAYLQLEKKLFDKLNLSFGARYEANQLNNPGFVYRFQLRDIEVKESAERESRPVFRFGANYEAGEATFLRASWGQGYRYPTIAERYIFTDAGGFFITPSPELGSETGWSAEVGLKQGYRLGGFEGFVDFAAFYMYFNDMIEFNWVGTGFQTTNIGNTSTQGIEISVAGRGQLGSIPFRLLTGYTYADPRFEDFDPEAERGTIARQNADNSSSDDNVLKYRFRHVFKFDGELEFGAFRLGLETFYNSTLEAYDSQFSFFIPGLVDFQMQNPDGFWVHNLRLAFEPRPKLRASLILGNLTNREYTLRPALMEAPRNLVFRFDYEF